MTIEKLIGDVWAMEKDKAAVTSFKCCKNLFTACATPCSGSEPGLGAGAGAAAPVGTQVWPGG